MAADALSIAKKNQDMLNALILQTTKLAKMQEEAVKAQEKVTKAVKENTEANDENDISMDRRSQALTKSIKILNKAGKHFELLSVESYKLYTAAEQGGNIFEYLNLALTSTNEQVKLMGIEAGTARRVMYGFLPPGMFRLVNKIATGFRFLGATVRLFSKNTKKDGEQIDNLFTKIGSGFKLMLGFREKSKKVTDPFGVSFDDKKAKNKAAKKRGKASRKQAKLAAEALLGTHQQALKNAKLEMHNQRDNLKKITKEKIAAQKAAKAVREEIEKNAYDSAKHKLEYEMKMQIEAGMRAKGYSEEYIKNQEYMTKIQAKRNAESYRLNEFTRDAWRERVEMAIKAADVANDPKFQEAAQQVFSLEAKEKAQTESVEGLEGKVAEETENVNNQLKEVKKYGKIQTSILRAIQTWAAIKLAWDKMIQKYKKFQDNKMKPIISGLGTFLWGALKFMAVVVAGLIALQAIWPTLQKVIGPVIEVLMVGLELIWAGISEMALGVMALWEAITGGDIEDIFMALLDILIGFGKLVLGVLTVVFGTLLSFIGELAINLWEQAKDWVMSLGNNINSVGKIVGLVLAVCGMIVAWLYGAPILLIIGLGVALYKFGKWFINKVEDFFFADGGRVETGMQVVGERGPELVSLPKGSMVHSNKDSQKMIKNSGGSVVVNNHITINAKDTSDAELRRIADKIGGMLNNSINRRTSSGSMG